MLIYLFNTAKYASVGISTFPFPMLSSFFLPFFCFSNSFLFLVTSYAPGSIDEKLVLVSLVKQGGMEGEERWGWGRGGGTHSEHYSPRTPPYCARCAFFVHLACSVLN